MNFSLKKGFTLVEVLTVIVIIGIVVVLAHAAYRTLIPDARKQKRQIVISRVQEAKLHWLLDNPDANPQSSTPNATQLAPYVRTEKAHNDGAAMFVSGNKSLFQNTFKHSTNGTLTINKLDQLPSLINQK